MVTLFGTAFGALIGYQISRGRIASAARVVLAAAILVLCALAFMAGGSSPVRSVECPCRK